MEKREQPKPAASQNRPPPQDADRDARVQGGSHGRFVAVQPVYSRVLPDPNASTARSYESSENWNTMERTQAASFFHRNEYSMYAPAREVSIPARPASEGTRSSRLNRMSLNYILNPAYEPASVQGPPQMMQSSFSLPNERIRTENPVSPDPQSTTEPESTESLPSQTEIRRRMWTAEEDEILRRAVSHQGAQNWEYLAEQYLPSRSARQLRARWTYYVSRAGQPQAEFTGEQDAMILRLADEAIQRGKPIKWASMVDQIGGKHNGQQLKFRYRKLLRQLRPHQQPPPPPPPAPL